MPKQLLIVDDDPAVLESCSTVLTEEGHGVETASGGAEAIAALRERPFDLMLIDLKMPGMDGIETVREAKRIDPQVVCLIFTAHGTIQSAVEAMKSGAFNYITKPFTADELAVCVSRALEHSDLQAENRRLRKEAESDFGFESIVTRSPLMKRTLRMLSKAAASEASVLVTGESGTGKELAARGVHMQSRRADKPFVPVDCAAIPENLLESELFGFERGAFTGADRRKRGLLEQADTGTLYLDEIGEMPLTLQSRLLRTLQERCFRRLGGDRLISVDIRIVSSTNRDLDSEVREGCFREDLLFRLNIVHATLPPLRERREDIPLLTRHFLAKHDPGHRGQNLRIDPHAMAALENYAWAGNIRELENVIERAVIFSEDGIITRADLPDAAINQARPLTAAMDGASYKESRDALAADHGRRYFSELLERHGGNVSQAARDAKISRKSFYSLLKKYGLDSKNARIWRR